MLRYIVIGIACCTILSATTIEEPESRHGQPVSVLALDAQGGILAEVELEFAPDWNSMGVGDPLLLQRSGPLSFTASQDAGNTFDDQPESPLGNYEILLRYPGAQTKCPFPLHPSGEIHSVVFPDGGIAVLRLPDGIHAAIVKASYGGVEYVLTPMEPQELAELQLAGQEPDVDYSSSLIEHQIALADNYNLVAYANGEGQFEALIRDAEVIVALQKQFRDIHGQYTHTMCQLYTGSSAIVTAIPRNPYVYAKNLCETEFGTPRPQGAIRYIPEIVRNADLTEEAVGFWLAVLGDGQTVEPSKPLPSDMTGPMRVVRWFEVHPDQDNAGLAETQ